MDQGNTITFVIPALNEERLIESSLRSILELRLPQNVTAVELVVVDNQSTDQTVAISHRLGAKVVSCQPGKPSRARNVGAEVATGNWIAFLDADCELHEDWLEHLGEFMDDPNVVGLGGNQIGPPNDTNWIVRSFSQLVRQNDRAGVKHVRWLPTAGLLLRRSTFEASNGFDESLTTCEDCDLGYRLAEHGKLLKHSSANLIHHGESRTLGEVFRREAWRTRDNMRLALRRPRDFGNWVSLAVPVCFLVLMLAGFLALAMTVYWNDLLISAVGILALGVMIPVGIVAIKSHLPFDVGSFLRRCIVVATYLSGRGCGVFWHFGRIER